ncbi:MAG: MFS transporter [Proteobacteria bacterium]|nr:MFS transporter [Pseudomonadota bacterium]
MSLPHLEARSLYIASRFGWGLCWSTIVTVNLVYMVVVVGLDPLQMVLVGTVLEASVFLFEIPTGIVADLYSRRLSVVIGHVLVGAGFLIIGFTESFAVVLLSQVIWGIGATFISGAFVAWLSGEIGVDSASETIIRGSQLGYVGSFVGILISVVLAQYSLALPIIFGSLGMILLGVAMAVLMPEVGFTPLKSEERETFAAMGRTFTEGVRLVSAKPLLILMLLITLVFGAFSEGIDRLFTPYLITDFDFPALGSLDTVVWWGIIAAISTVIGLTTTTLTRRFVRLNRPLMINWTLAGLVAGIVLATLGLAGVDGFVLGLAFYWLLGGLRSAYGPLTTVWLNQLLPERNKATLLSMYGQADAVGQVFGGPVIGGVARQASIAVALAWSAVVLSPALALYARAARHLNAPASAQESHGSKVD